MSCVRGRRRTAKSSSTGPPAYRFDPSRGGRGGHGVCGTPRAFCPILPGARIPTIAAPRPTILSPTRPLSASTIPRARFSRWRPPTATCPAKTRLPAVARAGDGAPTRSGANPWRGDAGRLQYFRGHAWSSAARPDDCQKGAVVLTLPSDLIPLNSDRLQSRMRQFARLIGGDLEIRASL